MKIGFVGLGKLGLPCALAIELKGHAVVGYDTSMEVRHNIYKRIIPYKEEGAQEALLTSNIELWDLEQIVMEADLIFVAVQTPHEPEFEGTTPLTRQRKDFDYSYLIEAVSMVAGIAKEKKREIDLVVISTVLPNTVRDCISPLLNEYVRLAYNPFFIAMGTTIRDFLNPEFILCGLDSEVTAEKLKTFYKSITDASFIRMNIAEAELTKVAYNTFIGMKIVFANTLMEICHRIGGMDVDVITDALKKANKRLISPAYLSGGMGDGGGCHPRDNIALSWLAQQLILSHDIFSDIMHCRENQTAYLAREVAVMQLNTGLPVSILGYTFKPETNLTVGSPAILLKNILKELDVEVKMFDPYIDGPITANANKPEIYFIGTKHSEFVNYIFPKGSIVIDPFRYIPDQEGVEVIRIGKTTN